MRNNSKNFVEHVTEGLRYSWVQRKMDKEKYSYKKGPVNWTCKCHAEGIRWRSSNAF